MWDIIQDSSLSIISIISIVSIVSIVSIASIVITVSIVIMVSIVSIVSTVSTVLQVLQVLLAHLRVDFQAFFGPRYVTFFFQPRGRSTKPKSGEVGKVRRSSSASVSGKSISHFSSCICIWISWTDRIVMDLNHAAEVFGPYKIIIPIIQQQENLGPFRVWKFMCKKQLV